MARADLLVNLVRAGSRSDRTLLRRTVEALAAEERAKHHHVLAERLLEQLNSNGSTSSRQFDGLGERAFSLVTEITPSLALEDIILTETVQASIQELVEEHFRADLLRSYNLEPRHRVLLTGPPGNGKTSLAEALAERLMVPLLVVRYEAAIGSYLGETANRLGKLFEQVRTQRCVLFFDEFDVLAKERGDVHETGEIKRVVSSLLLQIDGLPSHTIVVTATNHPELLDRAVWRRFQLRLEMPPPTLPQIGEWIHSFERRIDHSLGYHHELARQLMGLSYSELEDFGTDVHRRLVLELPNGDLRKIVQSRLEQRRQQYRPVKESDV